MAPAGAAVAASGDVAAVASQPPHIWILSPAFDLLFFVGSSIFVVLAWIAAEHLALPSMAIIGTVAVISNGPHLASTWTRVYLDGHERFKRPFHYFVVPALLVGFVVSMVYLEGRQSAVLRSVLFYWAFWHFVSQCWGILRIYQRKAGEVGKPIAHLERALVYLVALSPMVERLHTGPWVLFGAEIWHPEIPVWMVRAVWLSTAMCALAYAAARFVQRASGTRVYWIRPVFIAATAVAFYVPFTMIKSNGGAAFAAAACWHGFQYLGIVWFYNRNRWKAGVDPKAKLVSWISQPGRAVAYFLALLALVGIFYGSILVVGAFVLDEKTLGSLVWLSLTFGHYYLDGVIWKLRKPELAKTLGATSSAEPANA